MKPQSRITSSGAALRLMLAGLALNAALVLPAWWRDGAVGSVWLTPEAWLAPFLVAALPRCRASAALRLVLALGVAFLIVAGAFDGLVNSVLGRSLNVFVDPLMLGAGFSLVQGSLGTWPAVAASLLLASAATVTCYGVDRLLRGPAAAGLPRGRARLATAGAALLLGVLALGPVERRLPGVESQFLGMVTRQAEQFHATRAAYRRLTEGAEDPRFQARALPGLAGRDVYVVFIESYGASALDDARFSDTLASLLGRWEGRFGSAGLRVVSGRFEAPIRGGQSWLSHATLLSGLPIDNQVWYRRLLASDIDLLSEDFRATGHAALNIVPAIVADWPEGDRLGFDRVYAAEDMGYEGPRLGWVTMPDEYTLHRFSERIRPLHAGPVFAQFALISSHWPWHPVVEPSPDPARIGRGRAYAVPGEDESAHRPVRLLLDPDRLRRAYVRSLAYSLSVTFEWARRHLSDEALLIVLGDHQAVSLVTGRGASRAVPVHVISGDESLLARFAARGFRPGLLGHPAGKPAGMERLRHWLRQDFGAQSGETAFAMRPRPD